MKRWITSLAIGLAAAAAPAVAQAAPAAESSSPKNLARHHIGTNLFHFDEASQRYLPTESAAAWLDDDVATGWPPKAGRQFYLLALAEAQLLKNFALSASGGRGVISLYAGDDLNPPSAKSWAPLATGVAIDRINDRLMSAPFSRFAKYLLIEMQIDEAAPIFSLYLYGERAASEFGLSKRGSRIDPKARFGPFVNDQTAFSSSALYAGASVVAANGGGGAAAWQRAIDDNPQTATPLAGSADAGMAIRLGDTRAISRVSVMAESGAKGTLQVMFVGSPEPVATMAFDGSRTRASAEFAAASTGEMQLRWTPAEGSGPLMLREVNAFSGIGLAAYSVEASPAAVAEGEEGAADASDGKSIAEGDFKSGEEALPAVAEGPAVGKAPFVPGVPGFPPNVPFDRPLSE